MSVNWEERYWELNRENGRLGSLLGRTRRAYSRIERPEWANGLEWEGWNWNRRDQSMVTWCQIGQLEIDEDGALTFDNFDEYSGSDANTWELCSVELCKKIADLIIAEHPPTEEEELAT